MTSAPPLPTQPEDPDALVELTKIAEAAERHNDMCFYLKKLVAVKKGDLGEDERQYLSVAFKNVVGLLRSGYRALDDEIKKYTDKITGLEDRTGKKAMSDRDKEDLAACKLKMSLAVPYKELIKSEVLEKCQEVVDLLSEDAQHNPGEVYIQIPSNPDGEAEINKAVFYLKMKGDYYRYMAEVQPSPIKNDDKTYGQMAIDAYELASQKAEDLKPTHPTRLGLALNRSVCYYEIMKQSKRACQVAKEAFDLAIQKLDTLNDATYKDSTLIMQLLRDNLTLWTSEETTGDVEEQED